MNKSDEFLRKICAPFFRLIHKDLSEEEWTSFLQFIKFCLVGVSNTLISYALYTATVFVLTPLNFKYDYVVANLISFILSVLWSFYWNNRYVFTIDENSERSIGKALIKTYISYSFSGILLTNILSWLWIDVLGINKYIAPLINLIVSVPLNFILNKFWAFKSDKKQQTEEQKEDRSPS